MHTWNSTLCLCVGRPRIISDERWGVGHHVQTRSKWSKGFRNHPGVNMSNIERVGDTSRWKLATENLPRPILLNIYHNRHPSCHNRVCSRSCVEEFPRTGDQMHQSNFRPCGDFAGPPDWRVHCEGVIAPKRNLFVAAPCCGCLAASTQLFQGLVCNYMLNNVYDLEDVYEDVIKSFVGIESRNWILVHALAICWTPSWKS